MNPFGDGWKQNIAVGVAERDTGDTNEEPSTFISLDDDEDDKTDCPADQTSRRSARRRKRIAGVVLFLFILIVAGAGLWLLLGGGGKTKIKVPVRDNAQRADQATAGNNDETAQAIAEIRSATASPSPAASASPATGVTEATGGTRTIILPTTPVTVPIEGTGSGVSSPSTEAPPRQQGSSSRPQAGAAAKPMGIVSERNPERSIRCAPAPVPVSARQAFTASPANAKLFEDTASLILKQSEMRIVLPPFGAMLPIRTTGALYTLRPGLARFELTRDVRGQGWHLRKGTTVIGQQQGSEYDRAYISLMGFIDPESKRFVKAPGEVLGADGAPGLQGKRRQVSSKWARVLSRVATSAVSLGQAALARGNSTTVVLPGAVAPELIPSVASRREFVEVPAGTPAFVMITDLPKEAQAVDVDPLAEGNGEPLTNEELAELLSSDSPEKIRAAMPRMTPELRRIAEAVLKEQNR
jgi:hypothetical protein